MEIYFERGVGFEASVSQPTDLYALGEVFINRIPPHFFK